jgi:hypothetical protein
MALGHNNVARFDMLKIMQAGGESVSESVSGCGEIGYSLLQHEQSAVEKL